MKSTTPLVALALALTALTGCAADGVEASPQPSDTVVALEGPLEPHLRAATEDGDAALVEVILSKGVDVNADLGSGVTALHLAAINDSFEVAQVLLDAGADVNASVGGMTPLHYAAQHAGADLTTALLEAGADPLTVCPSTFQGTPIHWAAHHNNVATLEVFLEWGVDMEIVTDFDRTPLSEAARGGAHDTLAFLIDRGAETSLRDTFGTTPLGWVVYNEDDDGVELLEAAGATL